MKLHLLWTIPTFFLGGFIIFGAYQSSVPSMSLSYYLIFNLIMALIITSINFIGDFIIKRREKKV